MKNWIIAILFIIVPFGLLLCVVCFFPIWLWVIFFSLLALVGLGFCVCTIKKMLDDKEDMENVDKT